MKLFLSALTLALTIGSQTALAAEADLLSRVQVQLDALHQSCDGGDLSAPVSELTRIAGTLDESDANDLQVLELVSAGLNYAATVCAVIPQLNAAAHKADV